MVLFFYIHRIIAVAAVFMGGIFFSYWLLNSIETESSFQQITVSRGQQIKLALTDGTEVWLNSLTSIKYDPRFNSENRVVYLDGEAYFEVTHNEDKPFVARRTNVMSRCWERNLTWRHTVTPRISVRH